jgi:hypothetical protein
VSLDVVLKKVLDVKVSSLQPLLVGKPKLFFGKVQKHEFKMISSLLDPMLDWAENLGKNRKGHIDWMVRFSTSMMIGSTTPQFSQTTNHMNGLQGLK